MVQIKTFWLLTALFFSAIFLSSCGYDTAIKYKLEPSVSIGLRIESQNAAITSSTLRDAFAKEGLEPIRYAHFDDVNERYYISDNSNQTTIIMYHDRKFNRAIIAVYPARLANVSSKRKKKLQTRESKVRRIADALIQTESFSRYVPAIHE